MSHAFTSFWTRAVLRRWPAALAIVGWMAAVLAGFACLELYARTPGRSQLALPTWPQSSHLVLGRRRATVVMFTHPKCNCTRASLAMLDELVAGAETKPKVILVAWRPESADDRWLGAAVQNRGNALADAEIYVDRGGAEARRFRAETSGEVLVYDPAGQLQFHGGITPERGQTGANLGAASCAQCLTGEVPLVTSTPTYGCSLFADACPASELCGGAR